MTIRFDEKNFKILPVDDDAVATVDSTDSTPGGNPKIKQVKCSGLQNYMAAKQLNSAGVLCTEPSFTDNGDGTIDVDEFEIAIYNNSTFTGARYRRTISASSGVELPHGTSYIVARWPALGSPYLDVITDVSEINESNVLPVFAFYLFEDNTLQCLHWGCMGSGLVNKLHQRLVKTERFRHEQGLSLGANIDRYIQIGAGVLWFGGNRVPVTSAESHLPDQTTRLWYKTAGGVWTFVAVTKFNNSQYSTGAGLAELTNNRYAVNWIFRAVSQSCKDIHILLGNGDYSLSQAQSSELSPEELPPIISTHTVLVGRIIVKKDDDVYEQIDSAFSITVGGGGGGGVSEHNDLSGIQGGSAGEYYHLTSAQVAAIGSTAEAAALGRRQAIAYGKLDKDPANINRDGSGTFSLPNFLEYNQATASVTLKATMTEPFAAKLAEGPSDYIYSRVTNVEPSGWAGLAEDTRHFLGLQYNPATDLWSFIKTTTRPVYALCKEELITPSDPEKYALSSIVPISYQDAEGPEGFSFESNVSGLSVHPLYRDADNWVVTDTTNLPVEIQVNCPKPFDVASYSIRGGAVGNNSPNSWTLEGSLDGVTWHTLDSRSGENGWASCEKRIYSCSSMTQYRHFRLTVSAVNGGISLAIGGFDLFEKMEYVFDISEMTMYIWNSSTETFDASNPTIFIGEIALNSDSGSGPVLDKLLPYALQGCQNVDWFHCTPENNYVFDNHIGAIPNKIKGYYKKDIHSGEIREIKTYGMNDAYGADQKCGCFTAANNYNFRVFVAGYYAYDTTQSYTASGAPSSYTGSIIEDAKNYRSQYSEKATTFDYYGFILDRGW